MAIYTLGRHNCVAYIRCIQLYVIHYVDTTVSHTLCRITVWHTLCR